MTFCMTEKAQRDLDILMASFENRPNTREVRNALKVFVEECLRKHDLMTADIHVLLEAQGTSITIHIEEREPVKLLGVHIGDNDFNCSLFEAIKNIRDSHENWREMLNAENPLLLDVLAYMTSQHQAMARADLYLLSSRIFPFDVEEVQTKWRHDYEYLKTRIKFMVVNQAHEFPDHWENGESVGIDLTSGYMWVM